MPMAGQMNLYLKYALEHWFNPEETHQSDSSFAPKQDAPVAHDALGSLGNHVQYHLQMATEEQLSRRLEDTVQALLEADADITAGRTRPAEEVYASMRSKHGLPD